MATNYLSIRRISFSGPGKESAVDLRPGINVICGASDTGKSFLAEAIDFMLGGSEVKEIPERVGYSTFTLDMSCTDGSQWSFARATTGGDFALREAGGDASPVKLRQSHAHERVDNVSGYLLDKIGLLGRRILKSSAKGTTNSLSFRNLARLVIVQEGEIQQKGSPFWGGQFTLKTAELATVKLLLTGVDDSAVVSAGDEPDNSGQVALLDELIADLLTEIADAGHERSELQGQLDRLNGSIEQKRESLTLVQKEMGRSIALRRELLDDYNGKDARIAEIKEMLERFRLLGSHYQVDKRRLAAIQESGSLFVYVEQVPCPLCGSSSGSQHADQECDGDVASIVQAAGAEIGKIERLVLELGVTVDELQGELGRISSEIVVSQQRYREVEAEIRRSIAPEVEGAQAQFFELVEELSSVQNAIGMFDRLERLYQRRAGLDDVSDSPDKVAKVVAGIPDAVAHLFSMKVEHILRAWNFPGECRVHFDKETSDFVIDGKPRGSRGKGLRAITHAAVSLALLEYCRERSLPHPGFVVMDSPLLAYFKPEGEDDTQLQGTDLKERFYSYLKTHHGRDSQIVIIENQHPPASVEDGLAVTVFTGNPGEGRFGLL